MTEIWKDALQALQLPDKLHLHETNRYRFSVDQNLKKKKKKIENRKNTNSREC